MNDRKNDLPVLRPRTDAYETDQATQLVLELPGVPSDSLEVSLEEDLLTVRGKLELPAHEGLTLGRSEFESGSWERSFRLADDLDVERIEASSRDGLLTLTIPRRLPERRSIPVRGA